MTTFYKGIQLPGDVAYDHILQVSVAYDHI